MATKPPRSKTERYLLRLYVADSTPKSAIALGNLRQLCEQYLVGRYNLEVIDLLKNPELAKADQIVAVPTLVRRLPSPLRRFIGTLADTQRVLIDLDVSVEQAVMALTGKVTTRA